VQGVLDEALGDRVLDQQRRIGIEGGGRFDPIRLFAEPERRGLRPRGPSPGLSYRAAEGSNGLHVRPLLASAQ
jgi:hypothetical protein